MLGKTHLAISIAVALYFLPYVNNKLIFIPAVIISGLLPDIDSGFSKLGSKSVFRPVQWVSKHRGFLHSYSFCIIVSVIFAFYYPILALPFFLGYSFHLFADSFTVEGIQPFWPFKMESKGVLKTGTKFEEIIFVIFVLLDVILLLVLFAKI